MSNSLFSSHFYQNRPNWQFLARPGFLFFNGDRVAVAAVHRMDILLTWNCTHIHNIAISRQIERICLRAGWPCPAICTPFDLLEP